MKTNCHDCGEVLEKCLCGRYPKAPYLHDANATKDDPTPGGPITRPLGMDGYPGSREEVSNAERPDPTDQLFRPDCIRTVSGRYVNLREPDPDTLDIEDIAHALSQMCRFGGHLPKFYSVAQHAVLCSTLADKEWAYQALMHDAAEAYYLDLPSPLKALLPEYKRMENEMLRLLSLKFNFPYPISEEVKAIDAGMLEAEYRTIMLGDKKVVRMPEWGGSWSMPEARIKFLDAYAKLRP